MPLANFALRLQALLDSSRRADWLAPLLLRVYLTPVMWMAGWNKAMSFADTVDWFGNAEWGLGLPFPALMASLAIAAELGGALSLALGLALRWMALPMMATMLVAIATVHWENGWLAISEGMGLFATERTMEATAALHRAKELLMQSGEYEELTRHGSLVVLNNGVEFAVTYLVMLLSLFFTGAGRWISLDYWIRRRLLASAAARTA